MNTSMFSRIHIILLALLIFSLSLPVFAEFVQPQEAKIIAQTWLNLIEEKNNSELNIQQVLEYRDNNFTLSQSKYELTDENLPPLYLILFHNNGFVLISAEDNSIPVLAYSSDSSCNINSYPPAFLEWVENYAVQIRQIRDEKTVIPENAQLWQSLFRGNLPANFRQDRAVRPLIVTNWDQGWPYNELCPADPNGPGGHVYAGCVATAMGMVMKYWSHPTTGVGSHSYYCPGYGYQSANFGATTYLWDEMPNSISTSCIPIATLLYHCGVAVNMGYSVDGSGAQSNDAANALVNYFRYPNAVLQNKMGMSDTQWNNLLQTQLDNGCPMYYSGSGSGGGHAFVIDGYQTPGYYHFNFGWSGSSNGYYYINNINPGGYDFNSWNSVIANSIPQNYNINQVRINMNAFGATVGTNFNLTVSTFPVLGSWNVNHFEFTLIYDSDNITFNGASIANGIASDGNLSVSETEPGYLQVSWNGNSNIIGSGDLITFSFHPLDTGQYLFDMVGMTYNNTPITTTSFIMVDVVPPVTNLTESTITMLNVMHLAYNQIGTTEIRTTYLLPSWNVTHYQFDLNYDPSKLQFMGIDTAGTISAGCEPSVVINNPGSISISCDSNNRFTGDGALLKFHFKAIGNGPTVSITQVSPANFFYNDTQIFNLGSANFILSAYTANDDELAPELTSLQIFPNPFINSTQIKLNSKASEPVQFTIYNLKGQKVSSLVITDSPKTFTWIPKDMMGKPLPTGVYLLSWEQGKEKGTAKLLYFK